MLSLIYKYLQSLQKCFTRNITFKKFVIVVIGLMIASDQYGVSSIIRALNLSALNYESLLGLFTSTAFTLPELLNTWIGTVSKRAPLYRVNQRAVLIGDHKKLPKEACRMPGVKRHKQDSENAGKPKFILGHCFGSIGILIGEATRYMCLPLIMRLHDGLNFIANWHKKKPLSMVERIIEDANQATLSLNEATYVVLDAFFLTIDALKKRTKLMEKTGSVFDLISRAKNNCLAYYPLTEEEKKAQKGKVGRPREKGADVKVSDLFDQRADDFKKAYVKMYGEKRLVRYFSIHLQWGKTLYEHLQFVLVEVGEKRLILASTDLKINPKRIIHLYACRFSIEETFRFMGTEVNTFCYRFWSKHLKKLNRYYKSSEPNPLERITDEKERQYILKAIERIHRYVNFSSIALGLLEVLCFEFRGSIDPRMICFMRTYRGGDVMTVGLMKRYLSQNFFTLLYREPVERLREIILERQSWFSSLFSNERAA